MYFFKKSVKFTLNDDSNASESDDEAHDQALEKFRNEDFESMRQLGVLLRQEEHPYLNRIIRGAFRDHALNDTGSPRKKSDINNDTKPPGVVHQYPFEASQIELKVNKRSRNHHFDSTDKIPD